MGEKTREVVVDTYALMAMVFDELGEEAEKVMLGISKGIIRGLIPTTVGYEFTLQWLRGRVPGLSSLDEVEIFLHAYFDIIDISLRDFIEIARIKYRGDKLLSSSNERRLTSRRLSLVDSSVILISTRRSVPIVTGDRDLSYVAEKMGLKVIW